jgi:hypothetical protein
VVREILDRKVEMRMGGVIRKISVREAILAHRRRARQRATNSPDSMRTRSNVGVTSCAGSAFSSISDAEADATS